jgi:predicted amidohydrolase
MAHDIFMIQRAGFFHFVQSYHDPVGELSKAIERWEKSEGVDIHGSLIVVPESFNLGREHSGGAAGTEGSKPAFDVRYVLQFLTAIAKAREMFFVVALIDGPLNSAPLNSAYFVDGAEPRLMCHKIMDDGSREYLSCAQKPNVENPVEVGNVGVGALICMDALQQSIAAASGELDRRARAGCNARREALLSDLDLAMHAVVCVPAHMHRGYNWIKTHPLAPAAMPGKLVIVANSQSRDGCGSCILDRQGKALRVATTRQNQLCLARLDEEASDWTAIP